MAKPSEATKILMSKVRSIQTSQAWKTMCDQIAFAAKADGELGLRRVTARNALISLSQSLDLYIGTQAAWGRYNRTVKPECVNSPIIIVKPVTFEVEDSKDKNKKRKITTFCDHKVWGLSQTEGEPLPEFPDVKMLDIADDAAFTGNIEKLRAAALSLGPDLVTSFELRARTENDPKKAKGWLNRNKKSIVVITGESGHCDMFTTAVHELAHADMHGSTDHHERPMMEVEAESVAYIVCSFFGLDTGACSFDYIAHAAGKEDGEKMIAASLPRIIKTANKIIGLMTDEEEIKAEAAE